MNARIVIGLLSVMVFVQFLVMPMDDYYLSYAQKTHQIAILSGAADPQSRHHYSPPEITIAPGDIVEWSNGDADAHTMTSIISETDSGVKLDSGTLVSGEVWTFQFTEKGVYDYFCMIHPWAKGVINVRNIEPGFKVIHNVGADLGDGTMTFDVEYSSIRKISSASVNEQQKKITFNLVGVVEGKDQLVLKLPEELINGPFQIYMGRDTVVSEVESIEGNIKVIKIPLKEDTKEITIVGTSVVPEFDQIATLILASLITTIILFSTRAKRLFSNVNGSKFHPNI